MPPNPHPPSQSSDILLSGAGIGGLSAAIALAQQGLGVQVFERAPELRACGSGISLQPNAVLVLRQLGLMNTLKSIARPVDAGLMRDERGTTIFEMAHHTFERRYGVASFGVHRGKLIHALHEHALDLGVKFHWGRECCGFESQADNTVLAHFSEGSSIQGSALIGCDGIWSKIREQLHGAQEPRYAGYTCWRGVSRILRPGLNELWGPSLRFGYLPIAEDQTYWFAVQSAPAGGEDSPNVLDTLRATFADWPSEVGELLANTQELPLRSDIFDRPPLDWWSKGPVTLLGDAAHAMTPNLGQGACQAIEDAWVLAQSLAESSSDRVEGLRAYEKARIARANSFVKKSWSFGRVSHGIRGTAVRRLRDRLLSLVPHRIAQQGLDQQFGHGPVNVPSSPA